MKMARIEEKEKDFAYVNLIEGQADLWRNL
jgi:hypothetical protein